MWDLRLVPDEEITREYQRRLNLRRNRRGSAAGGQPKKNRPCPHCSLPFGTREWRLHVPRCPSRPQEAAPLNRRPFELVFAGAATAAYFPSRYRRYHRTFESAQETAGQVFQKLRDQDLPVACHTAIVFGPGCGKDGRIL